MKNKTKISIALILVIATVISLFFSSCDWEKNDPSLANGGLVIVLGNHANARTLTSSVLKDYDDVLEQAFKYYKDKDTDRYIAELQLQIIVCDGKPELVELPEEIAEKALISCRTEKKRKREVAELNDMIKEYLMSNELRANDEEVDLHKALTNAKHLLNAMDGERNLLILDTCLPTSGYIDFTACDLRNNSAHELYNRIPESQKLNFDGVNVYIGNFANIAGAQSEDTVEIEITDKLIEFWTMVFGDSLAKPIKVAITQGDALIYDSTSDNSFPYVSAIPIAPITMENGPTPLSADEVGFKAYSSKFANTEKANSYIKTMTQEVKEYYDKNPNAVFYVVGSIARDDPNAEIQKTNVYSKARAEKIAQVLINEVGIPASNIVVIDAGMTPFSWRNADEFKSKDVNEIMKAQAANRVVTIIEKNSHVDEYNELVSKGYIK